MSPTTDSATFKKALRFGLTGAILYRLKYEVDQAPAKMEALLQQQSMGLMWSIKQLPMLYTALIVSASLNKYLGLDVTAPIEHSVTRSEVCRVQAFLRSREDAFDILLEAYVQSVSLVIDERVRPGSVLETELYSEALGLSNTLFSCLTHRGVCKLILLGSSYSPEWTRAHSLLVARRLCGLDEAIRKAAPSS